ncbi:PREDICTED: microtubule-actin cross-linking factor 1-like [Priapulus caudatus]|uniref:Microtubule-actin cross-linking factor 1-like n=1 Tax=Priapulus caudatus TaxID=37621 RepID=A0ABM1E7B6_PRICU|nr:PREDICTED: microtubule-actin cross-linking factor 1-like [Priapulus caudatus]
MQQYLPLVASIEEVCAELCELLTDESARQDVRSKVAGVKKDMTSLQRRIEEGKTELEAVLREGEEFREEVTEMASWLADQQEALAVEMVLTAEPDKLEKQFDLHEEHVQDISDAVHHLVESERGMGPVARDVDSIHAQLDELGALVSRVRATERELGSAEAAAARLQQEGYMPNSDTIDKVEQLKRQVCGVKDACEARQQELDSTLDRLDKLYSDLSATNRSLEKAEREHDALKPIAADVTAIRAQQHDLKGFQKCHMEPLAQDIEAVLTAGQALVQSGGHGVNTSTIDSDLERLGDRWTDLKEKASQRERRLDTALMQCGKLQDALTGMLGWLGDMEDMIAIRSLVCAQVVKAQLQEQKFVDQLLSDDNDTWTRGQVDGQE